MKKKLFLKFFLFTVLATLVTFTSCKNYDDDIDSLQGQIEKLASKDDLTSQLGTLQSAVTAAQTAANNAMTKAEEALKAAEAIGDVDAYTKAESDLAIAEAKAETLAELETQMAALKAELEAANEDFLEGITESMEELTAKVEEAVGLMAGVVYDVEIITSFTSENTELSFEIDFSSATEQANVFQTGIANAITFVEGNQVQTGGSFVIRVSPTNVIVTPEMISIQNSMGVTYDNVVITKVEPEEKLITRAANGGGLWRVSLELKNYDEDTFEAATTKDGEDIMFAVAINNSGTEEASKVISSYDMGIYYEPYTPADELFYFVDKKHITHVNNRFDNSSLSLLPSGSGTLYTEKEWLGAPATTPVYSGANVNTANSLDNRSAKAAYPAVQGKAIKIALTDNNTDSTNITIPSNIRGMYVTLDLEANAIESAPSEWNAWKSYSYTGLNTVIEGTEAEIIINSNTAIQDMIGFRVYAVNFDGTLVDPDGKAFYVSLGKESTTWNAVNTVITATEEGSIVTDAESALSNVTLTELSGATSFEWTTDEDENGATPAFEVFFVDADGTVLFGTDGSGNVNADFSDVANVYTMPTAADWLAYKDNEVYNGTLTIKNATAHVLSTMKVTFKKVLPTAPTGFSVKTSQFTDGVYYSYLNPNVWAAPNATLGTMGLDQVFNFGSGTLANYETTFAASAVGSPNPVDVVVVGDGTLSVGSTFVDNTTEHATKVAYNFGEISTETKVNNVVVDYKVVVEEFPTVYSNIYNHTYSWNWATKAQLGIDADDPIGYETFVTYGDGITGSGTTVPEIDLANIFGVSTRDAIYSKFLDDTFQGSLIVESAKLVSDSNGLEEYFTVDPDPLTGTTFELVQQSGTTNPSADVPSTLILNAKDMYGNDVTIELPFLVKKR